jgi:hypothetical protein
MSLATETTPQMGLRDIDRTISRREVFGRGAANATMPRKAAPTLNLSKRIRALFAAAKEEVFEDGYESQFSRELVSLVERYGEQAIEPIIRLIVNEQVNPAVAAEALRWLGEIEDPLSYSSRRWLLERSLYSVSSQVRDGAILALASLDDPHAIPYLRRAIEQESCPELHEDMEQVLEQLLESE